MGEGDWGGGGEGGAPTRLTGQVRRDRHRDQARVDDGGAGCGAGLG